MFDTVKVQRMLPEFEQFVRTHPEIYIIPQGVCQNIFALLRRFKIIARGLIINAPLPLPPQPISGVPAMRPEDAFRNFNERTGVIMIQSKPQPVTQTGMIIALGDGKQLNIPMFVLTDDEALAIYDRLTMMRVLQQYAEDGVGNLPPDQLMQKFARGLTTFLDPNFQNVKVQFIDIRRRAMPKFELDDVGVVMQGPIVYENNYTIQTARQYRATYPNVPIVISTWKGEATEQFRAECNKHSIVLLENEYPPWVGFWHINCQLVSSLQGMKFLKENTPVKFALKTRVDQRFWRPDFLVYFKNMIKAFPPFGNRLWHRLISMKPCAVMNEWMPFRLCDFMSFGAIDDMCKYYDLPLQDQTGEMRYTVLHSNRWERIKWILYINENKLRMSQKNPYKLLNFNLMMNRFVDPETYIAKAFYRKYIAPIEPKQLLETYWKFLRDYVLLIDDSAIQFDWFKYDWSYKMNEGGIDQSIWLNFCNNFDIDWV